MCDAPKPDHRPRPPLGPLPAQPAVVASPAKRRPSPAARAAPPAPADAAESSQTTTDGSAPASAPAPAPAPAPEPAPAAVPAPAPAPPAAPPPAAAAAAPSALDPPEVLDADDFPWSGALARANETFGGAPLRTLQRRAVNAAMRGEDGQYDHFDVLLDGSTIEEGMEPLGQRRRPSSPARNLIRPRGSALANSHPSGHRGARLVAWAALNVLALAICLNVPPAASTGEPISIRLAQVAQQVLQQATHLFDSSGPGAFDPSSAAWVHANLQNEPLASSMALSIIPSHLAMPQVPEVVVM